MFGSVAFGILLACGSIAAGLWIADLRLRKSKMPQKTSRGLDAMSYCISIFAIVGLLLQFIKIETNNNAEIERTNIMRPIWDNFENTLLSIERICVKSGDQQREYLNFSDKLTDCENAQKLLRSVFYTDWLENGKIINLAAVFDFKTPDVSSAMRQFSDVVQKLNRENMMVGVIKRERSLQSASREQLLVLGLICLLAFGAGIGAMRRWFDYQQMI
jgi:hypothetical protein